MGSRTGDAAIDVHGLAEVKRVMSRIAHEDLNPAKRDLRQGTKKIAEDTLIPALKLSAYASGVPIAPKMADTMRVRSDRIVSVRVGAVNPKLRGFRKGVGLRAERGKRVHPGYRGSGSQGYRTTLAWGSERGPWPGGFAMRKDGTRGRPVNNYGVPRRESHWVVSGANAPGTWNAIKSAYQDLLGLILRNYGADR